MLPNFKVLFSLIQIGSLVFGKKGNDVSVMQKLPIYSTPPEDDTLIDQGKFSQN